MGPLTASTPKPLLDVAGKPIIEHVLAGLAAAGIRKVVIVTGYLGDQIQSTLGNGARFGLEVDYCRQERTEGTARALLLAERRVGPEPFLVGWGDILVEPVFYGEFVRAFEAKPCDALLAVNEVDDPWQGAAVYVNADWRVTKLVEKPTRGTSTTRWNNAGIHIFTPSIFDYARRLAASPRGEYELPQAVARMISDGRLVRAFPVSGFWSDVGTPEDLERAQRDFGSRPRRAEARLPPAVRMTKTHKPIRFLPCGFSSMPSARAMSATGTSRLICSISSSGMRAI
jgi:NDP-sugar pyrophosphorylase family protein